MQFSETDLYFRLLVLHAYHAGGGNVRGALNKIANVNNGQELLRQLWRTEYKGFKNASQNYSQIALAAISQLNQLVMYQKDSDCIKKESYAVSGGKGSTNQTLAAP